MKVRVRTDEYDAGQRLGIDWNTWFGLAEAVHSALGPASEVVVHDLSRLDSSIVYIAGDVTGRPIGAPATDLLLRFLHDGPPDGPLRYETLSPTGTRLKSTSLFLKHHGETYGAFCINVDVSELLRVRAFADRWLGMLEPEDQPPETFPNSTRQVVEQAIAQATRSRSRPATDLSRDERLQVIERLLRSGVFQLRKAHTDIAAALGVSRMTVYADLKEVRRRALTTGGEHQAFGADDGAGPHART